MLYACSILADFVDPVVHIPFPIHCLLHDEFYLEDIFLAGVKP